jgi:hypothetical protein
MIRYFNQVDDYIYEIEIPENATHDEDTLECIDRNNARYHTDRYIIRSCIYTPEKYRQLNGQCLDVCNVLYKTPVFFFKTYDRALQEISFNQHQRLKTVERDDFPSVFRSYFDDGKICQEFYHNKGVIEGEYKFFSHEDKLLCKCNFINGKIVGVCIVYDEENNFYRTYNFIDGKVQKIDSYYDYNDLSQWIIPHDLQIKKKNNKS